MSAVTPYSHPLLYKSILINSFESPGTVTLSDFPYDQDLEEQRAQGTTGSGTLNHGTKLARFTATFFLADQEDCDAWEDFAKMLVESTLSPKPKALFVFHPDLLRNRILDVQVQSIGGIVRDQKGGATVTVKFLQFKPAKPKPASKAEAGGGQRQGTTTLRRTDPNAERKKELAALIAQAKKPV